MGSEPTCHAGGLGEAYLEGFALFMSADSPWLHGSDPMKSAEAVGVARALDADWIMLPTHGAPMPARTAELCDPTGPPARERFGFPGDAAFRVTLAQMKDQGQAPAA